MNKLIVIFSGLFLCLISFPQEITQEAIVVNIEVPVRVFDRGRFIDNLTTSDFEVYEDGKPQEIVALYLIKKTTIDRKIEVAKEKIVPEVSRNFILIFEVREYLKRIDETLEYFFNNILLPGDTVKVVTPLRTYSLEKNALDMLPRQEIKNRLKGILRKDIVKADADRRSFCQHLENIVNDEGLEEELKYSMCMDILRNLKELTYFDESRLLEISDKLRQSEGQKSIFLFFQKAILPIPTLLGPEGTTELTKEISFNAETIKRALSHPSITVHFIFLTNTPMYALDVTRGKSFEASGIKMEDNSAEIFSAFTDMAKTTGGLTESSANAAHAFQKAVDASENYYLLYYHPAGYKRDGKFKEIKIRVKNKDYTITHRAGYFAD